MVHRNTAQVLVSGTVATALAAVGASALPAHADEPRDRDRALTVTQFADEVEVDEVLDHLDELQDVADENGGNRASGTPGYEASVEYVVEELRDAGYEPVVQTFEFPFYQEFGSTFEQVAPTPTRYASPADYDLFEFSGAGDVQAAVVPVDLALDPPRASTSGCEPADFRAADGSSTVTGRVALLQRGACAFGLKVRLAAEAGAVAAIVMNQGNENPLDDRFGIVSGTLGDPAAIPAVSVSFERGVELAGTAGLVVRVTADTVSDVRTTSNVIAETARGDDSSVVMAGAHLDSVLEGAGANDNGSGSAALLETAVQLAGQKGATHRNTVRFAWWGAEESGLLGSAHYVADLSPEDRDRIALYLNFDMIASPNYTFGIYDGDNSLGVPDAAIPAGSAQIEDLFQGLFAQLGEPHTDTEFSGRSDYGPFIEVGIPAGGLFTGAEDVKTEAEAALFGGLAGVALDPCYHAACDNMHGDLRDEEQEDVYERLGDLSRSLRGNVHEHALAVNTHVIAAAILSLARDASAVTGAA